MTNQARKNRIAYKSMNTVAAYQEASNPIPTKFQIGDRITNDKTNGTSTVIKIYKGCYVVKIEDTNAMARLKFQYENNFRRLS